MVLGLIVRLDKILQAIDLILHLVVALHFFARLEPVDLDIPLSDRSEGS